MKYLPFLMLITTLLGCRNSAVESRPESNMDKGSISNAQIKSYQFLEGMYDDPYFPNELVGKGEQILLRLCNRIERENPQSLEALYPLTHAATEEFNDLQEEFYEAGSELETAAREIIAMDFEMIASAYGFSPDVEELIAPREW